MVVSLNTLLERSTKNMGGVNPSLKDYALELIKRCYKEGVYVQLSSGYRSHEEQAKLFGQGRSNFVYKGKQYGRIKDANGKQLNIVTNAEPGQSIHNYGLAIDYFIVSDDGNDAIWTVNDKWKRVAAIAKKMKFEWGGDWSSFRDYPHLQFTGGLTLGQIGRGARPSFPKLISEEIEAIVDYLQTGDSGSTVKALQESLIKVGFKLSADGSFGPATEKALKAFQTANGLNADGYYGPATKSKLESILIEKDVAPVSKPITKPKEEVIEMAEKAIVVNGQNDVSAVWKLHLRTGFPIFARSAVDEKIAKELIIAGGGVKGLEKFGDKFTDLSGQSWEETVANVAKYVNK